MRNILGCGRRLRCENPLLDLVLCVHLRFQILFCPGSTVMHGLATPELYARRQEAGTADAR
jgi:hypothetical protein